EIQGGSLVLRRNDSLVTIPMITDREPIGVTGLLVTWAYHHEVMAHWSENELGLRWRLEGEERIQTIATTPTVAPPSLKEWVRKNNLEEVREYPTEEEFRSKVYACMASLQEKVNLAAGVNEFWDITYRANAISGRKPKRETDVHESIQRLLSD